MLKKIFAVIAIILVGYIAYYNITKSPETATAGASASAVAKHPELYFFWLPSGAPCQAQDKILKEIEADEKYKAVKVTRLDITLDSTSVMANKYGVRTVPTLVLTDGNGKTLKQYVPGVQSKASITMELDQALK